MLEKIYILFAKYYHNDQVKEDEMGRACSKNREMIYMI
jgi:hypothetical protein